MQENNDTIFSEIESAETEATSFQRFMTGILDFAIDILFILLLYKIIPRDIVVSISRLGSVLIPVVVILAATIYRSLFLLLFNKTIGMLLCRVKFLNKRLQPLSNKEKLFSIFRTRFSPIKLYKEK
jgi:uncharacterized RDD family membrane protein YckC